MGDIGVCKVVRAWDDFRGDEATDAALIPLRVIPGPLSTPHVNTIQTRSCAAVIVGLVNEI